MIVHIAHGSINNQTSGVVEVKPGQSLCGVAFSRIELTNEDLKYPQLTKYLEQVVFPRLWPGEEQLKRATRP